MNSKRKGSAGERELAKLLRTYGYDARRSVQYNGFQGEADVVGVPGLHIECKRCEQVRDEVFLQQAERDAKKNEIPVVMYRRSREKWKATVRLEVFMLIWNELTDLQKHNIKEKIKFIGKVDKIGKQ